MYINRSGKFLNRKKLTIISQSPDCIIADVTRADLADEEGTAIEAETFNGFENKIDSAISGMNNEIESMQQSQTQFTQAASDCNVAVGTAQQAKTVAENALQKAQEAKDAVASDRGSTVTINGTVEPLVVFDSAPQPQINNKLTKNFNELVGKQTVSNADLFAILNSDSAEEQKSNANISWQNIKQTILLDAEFIQNLIATTTVLSSINTINASINALPQTYVSKNAEGGFNLQNWKITVNDAGNIVFEKQQ